MTKPPSIDAQAHPRRDKAPPVRTMHDDVDPCSDDICCCEVEPRWQEVEGNDLIAARLEDAGDTDEEPARQP